MLKKELVDTYVEIWVTFREGWDKVDHARKEEVEVTYLEDRVNRWAASVSRATEYDYVTKKEYDDAITLLHAVEHVNKELQREIEKLYERLGE